MKNKTVFQLAILVIVVFAGCAINAYSAVSHITADESENVKVLPHKLNRQDESCERFSQDQVFNNFQQAMRSPERVRCLMLSGDESLAKAKHLPPGLGRMVNLEVLVMACLEELEDIPDEIGNLKKLQVLAIDNGNGCAMNVSIPRSIGSLENLRFLRLYGALDGRDTGGSGRQSKIKSLPETIGKLRRLEYLDLGRNGLKSVPTQITSLTQLKTLRLEYNDIRQLPVFVGSFTSLRELSLDSNKISKLPVSMTKMPRLKVTMGNNSLKLRDQRALRTQFPKITFSFENEYDDSAANEEARKPARRRQ